MQIWRFKYVWEPFPHLKCENGGEPFPHLKCGNGSECGMDCPVIGVLLLTLSLSVSSVSCPGLPCIGGSQSYIICDQSLLGYNLFDLRHVKGKYFMNIIYFVRRIFSVEIFCQT